MAWREDIEKFFWSGVNLTVVCADGAFPVGSMWQRSLSHGRRKVYVQLWRHRRRTESGNFDVQQQRRHFGLVNAVGVGQGWNNERAGRGDI